jgi:hypothetical protein
MAMAPRRGNFADETYCPCCPFPSELRSAECPQENFSLALTQLFRAPIYAPFATPEAEPLWLRPFVCQPRSYKVAAPPFLLPTSSLLGLTNLASVYRLYCFQLCWKHLQNINTFFRMRFRMHSGLAPRKAGAPIAKGLRLAATARSSFGRLEAQERRRCRLRSKGARE